MNRVIPLKDIEDYLKKQKLDTFEVECLNIPIVTSVPRDWDSKEDEVYD